MANINRNSFRPNKTQKEPSKMLKLKQPEEPKNEFTIKQDTTKDPTSIRNKVDDIPITFLGTRQGKVFTTEKILKENSSIFKK